MASDKTLGLATLERILGKDSKDLLQSISLKGNDSFSFCTEENSLYVSPIFSIVYRSNGLSEVEKSNIILVSAAGATGKTELVKRLSLDLHCPIVNLSKEKVVGGNSLIGMLFNNMNPLEAAQYINNLQAAKATIIIDALDEGYQKTNYQGFQDYLDDVIKVLSDKGISCILLGRTNAIDIATLYLEDKNVKCSVLQIEPFTIEKAKEFIDKQVGKGSPITYNHTYKASRDYILQSINCFFDNQNAINNKQYERFIGYAPVLLAISTYFKENANFQKILDDFRKNNLKKVSLIIDIVEKILKRDKYEKVDCNLIENLVADRDDAFKRLALETVYLPEEQCGRILYTLLQKPYPYRPIDDDTFIMGYEKGLGEWIKDHPFLNGSNKPANIVFESYVLARLLTVDKYKSAVLEYMEKNNRNSFIFFYIFMELNKDKVVGLETLPYLFESLKALDEKDCYYSLDLSCDNDSIEDETIQEVLFVGSDDKMEKYSLRTTLKKNSKLVFVNKVADIIVDAPIAITFRGSKVSFSAPCYFHCQSIIFEVNEVIVGYRNRANQFIIESENVEIDSPSGILRIKEIDKSTKAFEIVTMQELSYPLCDYLNNPIKSVKLTEPMQEAYQKMRRALIMFRSHSKGQLAKSIAKIDNRIGNTEVGKKVLAALKTKHIIYAEEHVYIIDNSSMDKYLGVKFDGIRTCIITETMKHFLVM